MRGTLAKFPLNIMKDVILAVHDKEYTMYSGHVSRAWLDAGLKIVAFEYETFPEKKVMIAEYAKFLGVDKIVIADDDLQLLMRIQDDDWRMRNQTPDDVANMFAYIDYLLDSYDHGALSPREGNNRKGEGARDQLNVNNTRAMRFHFFKTEAYLSCDHGVFKDVEDFDVTLQLLTRGLPNVVTYWYASGQAKTNYRGGCSLYRTNTLHDIEARRLQAKFPQYVSLRLKSNKADKEGFGTRTECTIQWKRAYEEKINARNPS